MRVIISPSLSQLFNPSIKIIVVDIQRRDPIPISLDIRHAELYEDQICLCFHDHASAGLESLHRWI
jgi:hypothetical protein